MQKQDQAITEYVRERFKKSATVDAARFDIKTENGVVELSGQTKFQVIVLEAAESARQVPGVTAVKTSAVRIIEGVEKGEKAEKPEKAEKVEKTEKAE
jgi:hyperosmotically inducible protein